MVPAEDVRGVLARHVLNAKRLHSGHSSLTQGDGLACAEVGGRQKRAKQHAPCKHEVPRLGFPVVLEEVEVVGNARSTDVTERGADPEGAVQQDEVQRHHQPDDGPGNVPGPGLAHPVDKRIHGGEGTARVEHDRDTQVTQAQPTEHVSSRPQMRRVRATIA